MTVLRVLSYNVRSLRGDVEAACRLIRDARPDVVCLQEAPRFLRWRTRCADFARRTGLLVVTGGRGAAGNLLLCQLRVEVEHAADLLLEPAAGMHRRGAAVAVCRLRGSRFALAGTHLDLEPTARLRHTRELLDRLPRSGVPASVPLVVAGDLNEEPSGGSWSLLGDRLTDTGVAAGCVAGTFPAAGPRRRIDAVFADPRIEVRSCTVVGSADASSASDHLPVLAELDLPH